MQVVLYWVNNNKPQSPDHKVVFDVIPERRRSATSIDSLEMSDIDDVGHDKGRKISYEDFWIFYNVIKNLDSNKLFVS